MVDYHLTIKELPSEERPREKLKSKGPAALSEAELLAIILRVGIKGKTVVELAQKLLKDYDGLPGLARASFEELCAVHGLGEAKAAQLKAALELGSRAANPGQRKSVQVRCPDDIAAEVMPGLRDLDHEELHVVLLNTKNRVLKTIKLYVGSLNTSLVRPAEVFKEAVRLNCAAVILAHNHPSGDTEPSADDVKLTEEIVQAGRHLDIEVLDHLIIGDHRWLSLRERRLGFP